MYSDLVKTGTLRHKPQSTHWTILIVLTIIAPACMEELASWHLSTSDSIIHTFANFQNLQ